MTRMCSDIMHDVTALTSDVTLSSPKMTLKVLMHIKCGMFKAHDGAFIPKILKKNNMNLLIIDMPDSLAGLLMLHLPLHIWAHPSNQSLQLFY